MPPENLAGRTVAGYRLLERIGEGGTATVYRADHPQRGRCAVKILKERYRADPTAVKRFLREAGFGARVQHPNVVLTYDYGEEAGLEYLALEWADGEALSDVVLRDGALPQILVGRIALQLADALTAAHEAGIIHRDLKPDNIIYNGQTQSVKLLDFGIARDAEANPSERLTRAGFFVGTLQYVAPEALSGELVGAPADIYSLATITYYLLTARHPYRGKSPRELFQQLLTEPPIPLNQAVEDLTFAPEVEAAVMTGLARDPNNRPPTARAFGEGVSAAVAAAAKTPETKGILGALKGIVGLGKKR